MKNIVSEKAIAAISTGQSPGGIGIVRISGENAREIADKVFMSKSGRKISDAKGYTALYGHVVEDGIKIDEAIALVFASPASYTGEDVVELSCHGGLVVMKNVLRAVLSAGARAAEPGEFTRRAFINGKMDLAEAEAVMQLIGANGKQAGRIALAAHEGALSNRIGKIKHSLVESAAHLSAWADYPEDDIPELNPEHLLSQLEESKNELIRMLDEFDSGRAIIEGVPTVIVGRPNVGKSTLMNLLSGCERSIVTEYAGTTRDIVEETVLLGDVVLRLSDTAGIRNTSDPVETIGVERARNRMKTSLLVLTVFDGTEPLTDEDRAIIRSLDDVLSIAIVNKCDLSEPVNKAELQESFNHIVELSAKTGSGRNELESAVAEILNADKVNASEGMLFNERQRQAVQNALNAVNEAIDALSLGLTLDAVTVSLEGAITALLELTGERASEAVVDEVFSHFCVGK